MNREIGNEGAGCIAQLGLKMLVRVPRVALRADTLGLAVAAIVATFALGTFLDVASSWRGGVPQDAIAQYALASRLETEWNEPIGSFGVFQVWRQHSRRSATSLMSSVLPFRSWMSGASLGGFVDVRSEAHPLVHLVDLGYGVVWMVHKHTLYFVLFGGGALVLWSLTAGAICRISGAQLARDELLSWREGLEYAWPRLWNSLVAAPCIPLTMAAVAALLLWLGGFVLWIPLLGDVVAGVAFVLAIAGGIGLTILLFGAALGGRLFAPATACDGSDGFDAFSRGLSYVFGRPWRTFFYSVFLLVYGAICWAAVCALVYASLMATRIVVGAGSSPLGWGRRTVGGTSSNKLEALWPMGGVDSLYQSPDWNSLGVFEHFSAVLIGFWVLMVIAVAWAYLVCFYYSSCTSVYLLLRNSVDGTDPSELFDMESEPTDAPSSAAV